MRKKPPPDQTLCITFCHYYKPGKNEELSCRGRDVVERLMQKGKKITLQKSGQEIDRAAVEMIVQKMCMACDFYKHDCDFMQDRKAPPCGGFVFLAQLLGSGTIKLDDIK